MRATSIGLGVTVSRSNENNVLHNFTEMHRQLTTENSAQTNKRRRIDDEQR